VPTASTATNLSSSAQGSLLPTSTAAVPAAAARPALVPDSPVPDAEPAAVVQEPGGDTAAAKPDTAGFLVGAAAMQVAAPSAGGDSVPAPHVAAPAMGGSGQPAGGGAGADTADNSRSSAAAGAGTAPPADAAAGDVAGGSAAAAAAFHGAAAAPAEPAAAPQATAAADPICPLCLGLLQSLDAGAAPPPQVLPHGSSFLRILILHNAQQGATSPAAATRSTSFVQKHIRSTVTRSVVGQENRSRHQHKPIKPPGRPGDCAA